MQPDKQATTIETYDLKRISPSNVSSLSFVQQLIQEEKCTTQTANKN